VPREQVKSDYTEDEIKNLEAGKCWCGKPRSEFDKGMRVYCCKDHRAQWYERTITWSQFRDEFIGKVGKKCAKCGCTPESIKSGEKSAYKDWVKLVKKNPVAMKIIQKARIQKLEEVEKQYQDAMSDDYLIKWEFGYRSSELPEGVPKKPPEDNWIFDRFEVDHIKAVSLGGEMWNEKNLQVLCYADHKLKTKEDMKKLRKLKKK